MPWPKGKPRPFGRHTLLDGTRSTRGSRASSASRVPRELRDLSSGNATNIESSDTRTETESDENEDDENEHVEEETANRASQSEPSAAPRPPKRAAPDCASDDKLQPPQKRIRRGELNHLPIYRRLLTGKAQDDPEDEGSDSDILDADLSNLDRYKFNLHNVDLSSIDLTGITLDFSDIDVAEFDFTGWDFSRINIVSREMSSQQGKWREEQVLIICPGSQTTMAQLGCAELTPPASRIPTRMFKDPETGEYLPHHTFKRKKATATNGAEDVKSSDEDDYEYVEDRDSVEGAVYPIVGGRIVNMPAFLAFLDHVHALLTTTYHNTPIVLMASPQWTRPDAETIARYIFEKTRTPALCLLHSAVAAQYGIKWPTMTVIDIGFEKVDVTCLYENLIVSNKTIGFPNPNRDISGGEVFTRKLQSLLDSEHFTYEMVEQLKRSPLCEVLPYAAEFDELMELPTETSATGQLPAVDALKINEPPKPAPEIGAGEEEGAEDKAKDEGVLDVANIVTSGNTREFLAKKEKEKEKEKAIRGKKGKGQEPEPSKTARLPNSKRKYATFHYEELVHEDVDVSAANGTSKPASENPTNGEAAPVDPTANGEESKEAPLNDAAAELPFAAEAPSAAQTERRTRRVRKDFEVGLERFLFADRDEIDRITTTIYHTIQSIDDIYQRSGCWDNLVFVGNGSRLRGLKENILQTLHARHLISPSSATIFTSELPSNMATPTGTGSQTPTGSFTGQLPSGQLPLPGSSSVNPLLQAATTASMGVPGSVQAPGSNADAPSRHSHAQTPTSIKLATLPTYLAEWTKNGFEESMFLGSLIAARLAYCIHNLDVQTTEAQRGMSLNRVDYNELGPKAIGSHSMMG
ncbi:Actin-like protein arp9 (SWI/SNF complex component arp9) [Pestalotiopsis sp. 9143b]|nr:Actin-like protein arp9 (SWI/SNF complex component arp9) [Pestalotiopsis sp. 9143b]